MRDASVLISGGSGFLGSHLVRRLVRAGARTHLLVRSTSSLARLADLEVLPEHTRVELNDAPGLKACVKRVQPDVVFHLAGSTGDRGRVDGPGQDRADLGCGAYEVNLMGTLRVLQAVADAAPRARIVRSGSIAEYGTGPVPFHEDQREQPASPYATSLVAAAHMAQAACRVAGLRVTTVRLAVTYGPGQSDQFLIPSLIRAGIEGRPYEVTSGDHTRDFIFVEDVVDGLLAAAATPALEGEIVNVGSGCETRVSDVAALIVRLTGGRTRLRIGVRPPGGGEVQRLVFDPARARRLMGWQPRTALEVGLHRTIDWFRIQRVP